MGEIVKKNDILYIITMKKSLTVFVVSSMISL
jgi:hypothetical protein